MKALMFAVIGESMDTSAHRIVTTLIQLVSNIRPKVSGYSVLRVNLQPTTWASNEKARRVSSAEQNFPAEVTSPIEPARNHGCTRPDRTVIGIADLSQTSSRGRWSHLYRYTDYEFNYRQQDGRRCFHTCRWDLKPSATNWREFQNYKHNTPLK